MVSMETQLSQIVQEEIELGEPRAKWILNHAGKEGSRLRLGFVGKQSFLNIADRVSVDAGDIGGCHQR